jgi:hypothetical protein
VVCPCWISFLNESVLERRNSDILDFVRSISGGESFRQLTPASWLTTPHDQDGCFLWTPAPAIADVAVFQLAEAAHVRPWNTHVMILPNLMTSRWRKMLGKTADLITTLPFDDQVWPKAEEFERLTIAIVFPLLAREPWRVKRSPIFRDCEHKVRSMSGSTLSQYRDSLREFWISARALQPMPSGMARTLLPYSSP